MAGVKETATWEEHVYQIEENDPVHGGENGVTNKPIKHLANRTLYLRKLLTEAGQRVAPKKITASTKNSVDLTGHTHEIDLASTTTKGLVQLTNDTGLDSESLALTAKAGKALAQQIAANKLAVDQGFIQNSKKSNAVNSASADTVATSQAVKTAYDKGVEAKAVADDAVHQYLSLPAGDINTKEYWQKLSAGRYWHSNNTNVLNAKSAWGHIDVLRANAKSNEYCVLWWSFDGNLHRAHINTSSITWHHMTASATTSQKGLVQLTNDTGLDSESLALTAKAGKALAQQIAQNKLAVDNGFIQNSKKSNAVNSTSSDTVATSQAVKTAYDLATTANNNANGRVSKAGDTLTGHLYIKNGNYSSVRTYNQDGWSVRWESAPKEYNHFATLANVDSSNNVINFIRFPKKTGNVIVDADVSIESSKATVVRRDEYSDIKCRLLKTEFNDETYIKGAIAFRVNNSTDNYTRYCNSPSAVRSWLGINDIATKGVVRKGYSTTIKGTSTWDSGTSKSIPVSGYTVVYPDGKIEQYFQIKDFRVLWFGFETAISSHSRLIEIPVPLWTAMPNQVEFVNAYFAKATTNPVTAAAESSEWIPPTWAFDKQASVKDKIYLSTRRFTGETDEPIDLFVKVTGY